MAEPSATNVVQLRSTSGGGGPTSGEMEARVAKIESDVNDLRVMLARIDERTSMAASKADIETLRADLAGRLGKVEGSLAGTLGFWQFLVVIGALLAIVLRWPELFRLAGITAP